MAAAQLRYSGRICKEKEIERETGNERRTSLRERERDIYDEQYYVNYRILLCLTYIPAAHTYMVI